MKIYLYAYTPPKGRFYPTSCGKPTAYHLFFVCALPQEVNTTRGKLFLRIHSTLFSTAGEKKSYYSLCSSAGDPPVKQLVFTHIYFLIYMALIYFFLTLSYCLIFDPWISGCSKINTLEMLLLRKNKTDNFVYPYSRRIISLFVNEFPTIFNLFDYKLKNVNYFVKKQLNPIGFVSRKQTHYHSIFGGCFGFMKIFHSRCTLVLKIYYTTCSPVLRIIWSVVPPPAREAVNMEVS